MATPAVERWRWRKAIADYSPEGREHNDSLWRLAERYAYRCWLCGDKVEMGEFAPHPLAPTRDHLLPKGQRPQTMNGEGKGALRLAHSSCNTKRGSGAPHRFRRMDYRRSLAQAVASWNRRSTGADGPSARSLDAQQ